jgi:hypothetical protein
MKPYRPPPLKPYRPPPLVYQPPTIEKLAKWLVDFRLRRIEAVPHD